MATVIIFWDYDTQWGADRSRTGGGAKNWGYLEFPATDRLLDLHAQYDLPACFAVVGAAALPGEHPYHDPEQIKRIHAAGHEIASHSFQHEWLPALNPAALRESLRGSKEALEQCIGAAVTGFVPPFDMPMDYPAKWAFNLTERREVRQERTDLPRLCAALKEVGYQFCRVNYQPFYIRAAEKILQRRILNRVSQPEQIAGLTCLRTNTPPGFARPTPEILERLSEQDGFIVIYGHPHHLTTQKAEGEKYLVPLLDKINQLRAQGKLKVALPRNITQNIPS
jgi:peptidoglycan/xylan/chitin deacetylase (PgdA/CDA1 family)